MDNSLLILQYIKNILQQHENLMSLITEDKICTVVAPTNTRTPFIVLKRTNLMTNYTKDRYPSNTVSFTITIIGDSYNEMIEIANNVRDAVENYYLQDENIFIHPISLTSAYEDFNDDGFVEQLSFETSIR